MVALAYPSIRFCIRGARRFAGLLFVAGLMACGSTSQDMASQGATGAPEYRLGSGDRVRITVLDQPNLTGEYRVDGAGKIAFPLIGTVDAKGMTLYTWDKDEMGVASNCYDKCAENWPPLLVPADTAVDGDWSLMDRKDSDMKIVAYKGWPLYLWIKDTKPGDTTGDGVGGTWHAAVESGGAM